MSPTESSALGSGNAILSGLLGDVLLNEDQAAIHLGVSKKALQTMRKEGIGPAHIGTPDGTRYRKADLDAWRQANKTGMPIRKT